MPIVVKLQTAIECEGYDPEEGLSHLVYLFFCELHVGVNRMNRS